MGFAVCPNEYYEHVLLGAYSAIVINGKCSLDEFTRQFKAGRLIALFQQYKVEGQVLDIPYMKDFLQNNRLIKSVWWLKAYIHQEPGFERMRPSIGVDYGIYNCNGVSKHIALMKSTYQTLFWHPKSDPLELHKACITGKIYPYVDGLLKLKKKDAKLLKKLMWNPYPLDVGVQFHLRASGSGVGEASLLGLGAAMGMGLLLLLAFTLGSVLYG